MFTVGPNEVLMILAIVVLLFGASKVPELARSFGRGMGEFKKAQKEAEIELREYERKLRESEYTQDEKRRRLESIAKTLGVDPAGKSDEELLAEINRMLPKREKASV